MDERGWQTVGWAIAAVAVVLVATRVLAAPPPPPPVELGDSSRAGERRGGPPSRDNGPFVHVAGAVRRPGLYRLPSGARVAAAVRRAGGAVAGADLALINLAARLEDGQQVVVPTTAAPGQQAEEPAPASPVSLGSATAEQLDQLDGIGPTLARRIVELRQAKGGFASVDQLAEVEGIGEKRLAALEAALTP